MPQRTDDLLEFGSPAWYEMLKLLFKAMARLNPASIPPVVCEIYRNAPPHLSETGRLVCTVRTQNGSATMSFDECPDDEADLKVVADYDALLPMARFVITDENEADFARMMREAVEAGQVEMVQARWSPPSKPDHTMHNLVAALTR